MIPNGMTPSSSSSSQLTFHRHQKQILCISFPGHQHCCWHHLCCLWGLETSADFIILILGKSLDWAGWPSILCLLESAQQMEKQEQVNFFSHSTSNSSMKGMDWLLPLFSPPSPVEEALHFTMLTADAPFPQEQALGMSRPLFQWFHWRKANTCLLKASDLCSSKCIKPFRKADK